MEKKTLLLEIPHPSLEFLKLIYVSEIAQDINASVANLESFPVVCHLAFSFSTSAD